MSEFGVDNTKKGVFDATVQSNLKVGPAFYRLGVTFKDQGATAFAAALPGQFLQLDVSHVSIPSEENIPDELADKSKRHVLLRRPLSFCDIQPRENETFVEILYRVVGPATLRMENLRKGDKLSITGPLGNGFEIPAEKKNALLVIGGIGAGPMFHLSKFLGEKHSEIERFGVVGARGAKEFPIEEIQKMAEDRSDASHFTRDGVKWQVCSDDGSIGQKGLVTTALMELIENENFVPTQTIIYACGPEPMLSAVANIAEKYGIDCQVSLERRMACGIGLCQSCAVECRVEGKKETIYKMCCQDGPVFDSREVVF